MAHTYTVTRLTNSIRAIVDCDVESALNLNTWKNDSWLRKRKENLEYLKTLLRPLPELPLVLLPEDAVEELTDILKNVDDALNELKQHCFDSISDWISPQEYFNQIHNSVENIYQNLATHLSHIALVDEKSLSTVNKLMSKQ